MRSNQIGIRISIFCITFLFGFFTVERFIISGDNFPSNKIEQQNTLKIDKDFNKIEVKQNPSEPPCRKFFNLSKYNDLLKEEVEVKTRLIEEMESSQDQKPTRRKLKKLEREIKLLTDEKSGKLSETTVKQFRERLNNTKEREQTAAHTLLLVENCAEYNESR